MNDGTWLRVAAVGAEERAMLPPFGGPEVELGAWWADVDDVG